MAQPQDIDLSSATNDPAKLISKDAANSWQRRLVWNYLTRDSDRDVANNTTVADDTVLQFDMDAATTYAFELMIVYSSPAGAGTPDFKFAFAGPATLTGTYAVLNALTTADAAFSNATTTALTTTSSLGTAATPRVALVTGWAYSTAGGAGASGLRLQWSQATSGGNATRVHAATLLRWRKLA